MIIAQLLQLISVIIEKLRIFEACLSDLVEETDFKEEEESEVF